MDNDFDISAPAILLAAASAERGYLGISVLTDWPGGWFVMYRIGPQRLECIARFDIPAAADLEPEHVELPELVFDPKWSPSQALDAAAAELRRMTTRALN